MGMMVDRRFRQTFRDAALLMVNGAANRRKA